MAMKNCFFRSTQSMNMRHKKRDLMAHFILLALLTLLQGCVGNASKQTKSEDKLFEDWIRVQLTGIELYQASTAQGDPRNVELGECLWQRAVSEEDCHAPQGYQYPVSFRMRNGYLLSSGVKFPLHKQVNWKRMEKSLRSVSAGFGFNEDWRPCVDQFCRFEVFTSFEPVCQNNKPDCGRAERIRISYVILSRNSKNHFWQKKTRLISNLDPSREVAPVEFVTDNIFGLPPLLCRDSSHVALNHGAKRDLTCGISKSAVESACMFSGKSNAILTRGGLCVPGTCERFCKRALNTLAKSCDPGDLQSNPRSPDLFTCPGQERVYYLKKPPDLPTLIHSGARRSLLARVFGVEPDFCIVRNWCFGRYAQSTVIQFQDLIPYLEVK